MNSIEDRATNPGLHDLWVPLLRELTVEYPSWAVWKNPESAFVGPGDIDSLAPPEIWDEIEHTFKSWASSHGFTPIIVCRHVPQGPHFIAVDPGWPHMLILDVKKLSTWRGSTLVDHRHLSEAAIVEDRGFRRIRPGAEGVAKFLLNGVLIGGRANHRGLELKGVEDLLRADREGVEMAAAWLGPLSGTLIAGIDAFLAGGWDRRAMAAVEAWATIRSVLEPKTAASRLLFKYWGVKRCEILQSVRGNDREIPEDEESWLKRIAVDHQVEVRPTN